jgi:glycosyltransferase involved in cell wall biosynthesis
MQAPAISVILPTYNRAALLPRAVASILANTLPQDEVIVVDDGSTDRTEEALAPFRDRLRYIRIPNGGAGAARNRGIREASRPLVAFMDSDDEWMPHKLHLQRTLMGQRPDVLFCFSDFGAREEDGSETRRYLINWHKNPLGWDKILGPRISFSTVGPLPPGWPDFPVHIGSIYLAELEADYVCTITLVAWRERAGDALHFAEDVATLEDWECIARLARAGPAAYLDCETAWQWGHAGPRLTDAGTYDSATARLKILKRVWGADAEFLADHGERFKRVCARYHLLRAQWLIHRGRTREARMELRRAGASPLSYRLLAALPGTVVRSLLAWRRVLFKSSETLPGKSLQIQDGG